MILKTMEEVNLTNDAPRSQINIFTKALRNDATDNFFEAADKLCAASKLKSGLVKNRRNALKLYTNCFKGDQFVDWLLQSQYAASRFEGSAIGCSLLMHGVIHHVEDDHNFKDEPVYYRFRRDDNTYLGDLRPFRQAVVQAVRLHGILRAKHPHMITNRDYGVFTYQKCVVASYLVDWLVTNEKCTSRKQAVDMMQRMQTYKLIEHVTQAHTFCDKYLYFRFYLDKLQADKGFLEFTKLEQGLAYLGHLDRGSTSKVPQQPRVHANRSASIASTSSASSNSNGGSLPRGLLCGLQDPQQLSDPMPDSDSDGNMSSSPQLVRRSNSTRVNPASKKTATHRLDHKWYHGLLSRDEVFELFQKHGTQNGRWLVRDYRKKAGWFVLSVMFEGDTYHVIIKLTKAKDTQPQYTIDDGPRFDSVGDLIKYYQTSAQREVPTSLVEYVSFM